MVVAVGGKSPVVPVPSDGQVFFALGAADGARFKLVVSWVDASRKAVGGGGLVAVVEYFDWQIEEGDASRLLAHGGVQ